MGGSSIGGALVEALSQGESRLPVLVNRTYSVPGWVDDQTIAVFTSYSGNTEETLAAFEDAGRRGAQRIAITTGGQLGLRCKEQAVPLLSVPGGLPPRAALPYTLVPQLHLASQLQISSISSATMHKSSSNWMVGSMPRIKHTIKCEPSGLSHKDLKFVGFGILTCWDSLNRLKRDSGYFVPPLLTSPHKGGRDSKHNLERCHFSTTIFPIFGGGAD